MDLKQLKGDERLDKEASSAKEAANEELGGPDNHHEATHATTKAVEPINCESTSMTTGDDDELEEGELKDDDDDDDDDDEGDLDEMDGKRTVSSDSSNNHEINGKKLSRASSNAGESDKSPSKVRSSSSSSSSSSSASSTSSSSSSSSSSRSSSSNSSSDASASETKKSKRKASSTRSSSPSIERMTIPHSYSSRQGSHSRQSSRSLSRSKRNHSPANFNQQARLVTMRARLLEAKSREIEMKFQKNKAHLSSAPITPKISLLSAGNLKSTIAKPSITYAENPNPVDPPSEEKRDHKDKKPSKINSKGKGKLSKKSKKRKAKSSSKKKKRLKKSETSRNDETNEQKTDLANSEVSLEHLNRQGPKTPPDNHVTTLEDEQVDWPSYLIKMTNTQPSISYSVNPSSVSDSNATPRSDMADLNADFTWYYNYLLNTFDMEKSLAQHQAASIIISSNCYSEESFNRWLEQQGYSKQPDNVDESMPKDVNGDLRDRSRLPLRDDQPKFTTLKSHRDIILPNGKVLPRGTVQKIVHPYPRPGRVVPETRNVYSDLF